LDHGRPVDALSGPARNAEELARPAAANPAARIWFLAWADAFRRLTLIRDCDRGDREGQDKVAQAAKRGQ
jgi:hypothetical protein